jgi:hypothetical protein
MTLTREQTRARAIDQLPKTITLDDVTEDEHRFSLSGNGTWFGLDKKYGVSPKIGDVVNLYTHRGSLIRGLDLNGVPVFYKTEADLREDHERYVEKQNRRHDEEFEAHRFEMDAAFDALPEVFKRRVALFRANNPRFRQDFEAYEMSACTDAVRLAEWASVQNDPGASITRFSKASYKRQKQMVPGLAYDQHSGNSFGFAVRLAFHYVTEPENVYQEHGAMVPLVGCEEYGCIHPRP